MKKAKWERKGLLLFINRLGAIW